MLEKSFGLQYFLKQTGNETKSTFIYALPLMDIPQNSLKKQWWENRRDQEKGRANGVKEDAREVNHFLDILENKVLKC